MTYPEIKFLLEIALITSLLLVMCAIIGSDYSGSYEYETTDGEKGTAAHCGTPNKGVPYCRLDDGTMVYGIKQYKKTPKEEE